MCNKNLIIIQIFEKKKVLDEQAAYQIGA